MKKLILIFIIFLSVNCYSQDVIRRLGVNQTFYVENFDVKENVYTYVLDPQNPSGMKFVFRISVYDCEYYETEIYGRIFKEDEWEFIIRDNRSTIPYPDKFLYYRELKLVSKTGAFKMIKTKLFYE